MRVVILGCTGSVGLNAIEIIRQRRDDFELVGLACGRSHEKLTQLASEFDVRHLSVGDVETADQLRKTVAPSTQIYVGDEGHARLVEDSDADVVLAAMSGVHGLRATLSAIKKNVRVLGIANKEVLVMAGPLIMEALAGSQTQVVPVDSEHSAIFQCLRGNEAKDVERIILTASGGPFRSLPQDQFVEITKAQALKHPNWSMGSKISIDSATMMNKGLEYIEALRLFPVKASQVEVLVHPQSIIHSMVEFCDHSIMAQLGVSDMKIPISLALSYPKRTAFSNGEPLDFQKLKRLDFEAVDMNKFPCLALAIEAERTGPECPLILNAANEEAVKLFLEDQIRFVDIPVIVEEALEKYSGRRLGALEDLLEFDALIRSQILEKWLSPCTKRHVRLAERKAVP